MSDPRPNNPEDVGFGPVLHRNLGPERERSICVAYRCNRITTRQLKACARCWKRLPAPVRDALARMQPYRRAGDAFVERLAQIVWRECRQFWAALEGAADMPTGVLWRDA